MDKVDDPSDRGIIIPLAPHAEPAAALSDDDDDDTTGCGPGAVADVVADVLASLRPTRSADAWSTGFADLDDAIGGLETGKIVVLAGRECAGHHAVALSIAAHVAVEQRIPTVIYAVDAGAHSVVLRLLAALTGVDRGRFGRGELDEAECAAIAAAGARLEQAPLWIEDAPYPTVASLTNACAHQFGGSVDDKEFPPPPRLLVVLGAGRFTGKELGVAEEERLRAAVDTLGDDEAVYNQPAVVATLDLPGVLEVPACVDSTEVRKLGMSEDDADCLIHVVREVAETHEQHDLRMDLCIMAQRRRPCVDVAVSYDWSTGRVAPLAREVRSP